MAPSNLYFTCELLACPETEIICKKIHENSDWRNLLMIPSEHSGEGTREIQFPAGSTCSPEPWDSLFPR